MSFSLKEKLKKYSWLVTLVYNVREAKKIFRPNIFFSRLTAMVSVGIGVCLQRKKKNEYTKFYFNKGIFVIPEFLSSEDVSALRADLRENIDNGNILTNKDKSDLKPSKGFKNSLINLAANNVVVHGGWNYDLYDYVKYVKSPYRNMPVLQKIIGSKFLPFLKSVMRSNVKIDLFAAYNSLNFNGEETFNVNSAWHRDGDPKDTLKCLIYLSDVTDQNGPFAYIDPDTQERVTVKGKAGTVLFFKSAIIRHRQTKTKSSDRYAITFRAHPSLVDNVDCMQMKPDIEGKFLPFRSVPDSVYLN